MTWHCDTKINPYPRYYETFCIIQPQRASTPSATTNAHQSAATQTPSKRPPPSPLRTPPSSPSASPAPSSVVAQGPRAGVNYNEFVLYLFIQLFLGSETFKSAQARARSAPSAKSTDNSQPHQQHKDTLRIQLAWITKHLADIFKLLCGQDCEDLTRLINFLNAKYKLIYSLLENSLTRWVCYSGLITQTPNVN